MPFYPRFTRVFVSHSSADADYAIATAKFLKACFQFKDYELICTSDPAHGPEGGSEFEKSIRVSIEHCGVFIALLSEASLASVFCTMEMGAAWGHKKTFKPVLLPSVPPALITRPISSMHLLNWSDPRAWLELADDVYMKTGAKCFQRDKWPDQATSVARYLRPSKASPTSIHGKEDSDAV
jgi:hypothetical protein